MTPLTLPDRRPVTSKFASGGRSAAGVHELHLAPGTRRLAAVKLLGWTEMDVSLLPTEKIVQGEHDENVVRKDFTPSEEVSCALAVRDAMTGPAAKARKQAGGTKGTAVRDQNSLTHVSSTRQS